MDDMKLKDFDQFRYAQKRPWIIGILLLILVVALVQWRCSGGKTDRPDVPKVAEQTELHKKEDVTTADTLPVPEIAQLLAQAKDFETRGAMQEARNIYLDVVSRPLSGRVRGDVEARLAKLHMSLVMTPAAMPEKVEYVVKRGDSVDRIAKKMGTTPELVQVSNQIKSVNLIKEGDRFRVFTGKFSITVSKSRNDLVLYMNDMFFKRYLVGTGLHGKTPVGTFVVVDKIKEPVWWRSDNKAIPFGNKENILGTRWMALKATGETPKASGYGIHGTWDNSSIGKAESAGCIRMRNAEVEELYVLVPVGTPVKILE